MSRQTKGPPFPDNPGAWLACFRHRAGDPGCPPSPERFGRLIGRSGATVRRWEQNRALPEDADIARMAEVCRLSALQVDFISRACSRLRPFPAPDRRAFRSFFDDALCHSAYPAVVLDSLLYVRAWNSYLEAVSPRGAGKLHRGVHSLAALLDSAAENPRAMSEAALWQGVRFFWSATAPFCRRPEYAGLLNELSRQPRFAGLWTRLALGHDEDFRNGPIAFTLAHGDAKFHVYTQTVTFPPVYHLSILVPCDEGARTSLEATRRAGPPEACYTRELHWLKEGAPAPRPRATKRTPPPLPKGARSSRM